MVRVVWVAIGSCVGSGGTSGAERRPVQTLRYATVQAVMACLTRKQVLARSRHGRADLYRAGVPDAASIAVSRVLAQFGEIAIRPFVEQVVSAVAATVRCLPGLKP